MRKDIALILNANDPKEMAERFHDLYREIDEHASLVPINLGNGFAREVPRSVDEVLFTGGTRETLSANPTLGRELKRFFSAVGHPVLGVCFGFQVFARAHEANLKKLPEKTLGLSRVEVVPGELLDTDELRHLGRVHESHTWAFDAESFPTSLRILMRSVDGVEAAIHRDRPQGGVQFHPERAIQESDGVVLFDAVRKAVLDRRGH